MRCVHSDVCKHTHTHKGDLKSPVESSKEKKKMGRPSSTACYCYFYYYYASSKIKKQGSLRWWVTFDCPISFFFSGRPSALLSNGKSSYLTQRKKNVEETEHQKLRDVLYFKRCDGRRERWQMTAMLPPFKYRGRSTMCGSATRPSSAICWVLLFFS